MVAMPRKNIDDVLAEARSHLRRATPSQAFAALGHGAVLVDTRSQDLRERDGTIPGSVSIPLSVLEWRVDPDSPNADPTVNRLDAELILICAHGYSSSLAALRLQDLGFTRVTDVIGGFEAWRIAGSPVVR
jgi:rhodanese-related sulfurtransferase